MGAASTANAILQAKKKAEREEAARLSGGAPAPTPATPKPEPKPEKKRSSNPVICLFQGVLEIINGMGFQTAIYVAFVAVFQLLVICVRTREEFYLDKHVMDRIVENHFDSSHNTFESIRRTADVYEWGNNVLWPGLFGDAGPCTTAPGSRITPKNCVDEVWPDGDGSFHMDGATAFGVPELVERMDQIDWTEGITIRVSRVAAEDCPGMNQLGSCYPELVQGAGATDSYGYNWTHPGSPLTHPFTAMTSEQLGSNPGGVQSASMVSLRVFDAAGYVAVVIPFFSDTYLPEQSGTADTVTDYRASYVTPSNGRTPSYYCVRLSPNGVHLRQLCDPGANGDGTGRPTGAVRAAVEEMWNDLKRGHFIDHRARVMTITMQLRNNHVGVRYRMTLMFEFTSLGAIFTSYDTETRVLDATKVEMMGFYANSTRAHTHARRTLTHARAHTRTHSLTHRVSLTRTPTRSRPASVGLGLVIFFCVMEGVEIMSAGVGSYFSDLWNIMDWANFILFYLVWWLIQLCYDAIARTPYGMSDTSGALAPACTSQLCTEIGYFDDWEVMSNFKTMKTLLALCVCIQLLKILKFLAALVPKTSLCVCVLKAGVIDLSFFGLAFVISMFAFSNMLFIQLGPVMEGYCDQIPAIISLSRALFGDFDIDEIMDNSSGYLNTILFLGYLFVAIFVMLSMFLAILAEAQIKARDAEEEQRAEGSWGDAGWADDFGVISMPGRMYARLCKKAPKDDEVAEADEPAEPANAPATEEATTSASAALPSEVIAQLAEASQHSETSRKEVQRVSKDMAMVVLQQIELMQEVRSLRTELKDSKGSAGVNGTPMRSNAGATPASGRAVPRTLSEQPRSEPSINV